MLTLEVGLDARHVCLQHLDEVEPEGVAARCQRAQAKGSGARQRSLGDWGHEGLPAGVLQRAHLGIELYEREHVFGRVLRVCECALPFREEESVSPELVPGGLG